MLKIKDNVDLKELEKYNLKKKILDSGAIFYTDETIAIDNNRKIDTWNYLECTDLDEYNDVLYNLIKDDLVEKVKE